MSYKRFYIVGSLSILGIFALIAPFIQFYYGYQDKIYCTDKCFVEFCIKNGNKDLYFYNKEELPLTFYPEDKVGNVKFYKADRRYKKGEHPGYREIDFITPYSKGVLYVFKIPAYTSTCYGIEIQKEWWADVKWSFGALDPELISGTLIGDKIVKEICTPIYTDIQIPHYYNQTLTINKTKQKVQTLNYTEIQKIQIDCIKTGDVNVSNFIYDYKNYYCRIEGTKLVCIHNKEGGQYNICKSDGSVTCFEKDLITNKEVFYNSLHTKLK